jgi:hypothetical protein
MGLLSNAKAGGGDSESTAPLVIPSSGNRVARAWFPGPPLPGASPNEGRTLWGRSLTCRLRPSPKASIPVAHGVGFLGAGKLQEPADQEVRPTLGSLHSERPRLAAHLVMGWRAKQMHRLSANLDPKQPGCGTKAPLPTGARECHGEPEFQIADLVSCLTRIFELRPLCSYLSRRAGGRSSGLPSTKPALD